MQLPGQDISPKFKDDFPADSTRALQVWMILSSQNPPNLGHKKGDDES